MIRALALVSALAVGVAAAATAQTVDPQQLSAEIAFLESRVARDEADAITPTRLGQAYLRQARATGEFTAYLRAEAAFEQALVRAPDYAGALTGLAAARAARHRFADALRLGERATEVAPDLADGYAVAGDAALEAGLLDKAAAMYDAVARLAPGYYADTRLANLAAAKGDVKAALAALARAEADAARRALPAELRAWCHVRAGALGFDRGDWRRAERGYSAALGLTPESADALEHMAELRAAQGRRREAHELYRRALAASPRPEFHEAVARLHQADGNGAAASKAFAEARVGYLAAAQAGDPGAYRGLALFYADVDPDPAAAVMWARKDAELRQDGTTMGVLAWALYRSGQIDEAAETATRAVERNPQDAGTWYRAGVIAMAAKDVGGARVRLGRALTINSRFDEAPDARRRLRTIGSRLAREAGPTSESAALLTSCAGLTK